jgi:hypothetical protein
MLTATSGTETNRLSAPVRSSDQQITIANKAGTTQTIAALAIDA